VELCLEFNFFASEFLFSVVHLALLQPTVHFFKTQHTVPLATQIQFQTFPSLGYSPVRSCFKKLIYTARILLQKLSENKIWQFDSNPVCSNFSFMQSLNKRWLQESP